MDSEIERTPAPLDALPIRTRAPPPPLPTIAAAATHSDAAASTSVQLLDSDAHMVDDVLLHKRWTIHWMSRMYHFRRHELRAYAHELVKFLRDDALAAYAREFGYKVSIRHTDAFVAFEVQEERDVKDAQLAPVRVVDGQAAGLPTAFSRPLAAAASSAAVGTSISRTRAQTVSALPPPLSFAFGNVHKLDRRDGDPDGDNDSNTAGRRSSLSDSHAPSPPIGPPGVAKVRRGALVLYFPNDTDGSNTNSMDARLSMPTQEEPCVVLLRGHVALLRITCAWLQQRFQCIVSERPMSLTPCNLKWLARTYVLDALALEATKEEKRDSLEASSMLPVLPLLLQYTSVDAVSLVQSYTLTVPWATLQRLLVEHMEDESDGNNDNAAVAADDDIARSTSGDKAPPDLIARTEALYMESLPQNLTAMELTSIAMADVTVDATGRLELTSRALVAAVLRRLVELLSLQNTRGPASPVVTL